MEGNAKMTVSDLTTELLKQIRDGVHETNVRLDQTNARLDQTRSELTQKLDQTRVDLLEKLDETRIELSGRIDQTNVRIDQTNDRLDQTNDRLDRSNTRLSDIQDWAGTITGHLHTLADKDRHLDKDVADLRRRVEALETRG
jgi:chromosome segregation ATPase